MVWQRLETRSAILPCAVVMLFCSGCGSNGNIGTVTGNVTYAGQPLAQAAVEFQPAAGGKKSVGYTDNNGYYELQYTLDERGAVIGRHKVRIITMPAPGTAAINIPSDYGGNSKLEYEVQPGPNRFDVNIPK
jgi:hypothetical protein